MRYRVEYETYTSKLATFASLLKSSIWVGLSVFLVIFNIPSFICLACGVDGAGIIFGIMSGVAVISLILFCIFVKPEKIDDYMSRRPAKAKKEPKCGIQGKRRDKILREYGLDPAKSADLIVEKYQGKIYIYGRDPQGKPDVRYTPSYGWSQEIHYDFPLDDDKN